MNVIKTLSKGLAAALASNPGEVYRAVIEKVNNEYGAGPTEDEIAAIKHLDGHWLAALKNASKFTDMAASTTFEALTAEYAKHAHREDFHTIPIVTKDHLLAEYEHRRRAANLRMKQAEQEAAKIAAPIVARISAALDKFVAKKEKSEKDEAGEVGLLFDPSPVLAAAKHLQPQLKKVADAGEALLSGRPIGQVLFVTL